MRHILLINNITKLSNVDGRVKKRKQASMMTKSAEKEAAKETPNVLTKNKNKRPISKKQKREIKAARASLASGELASEDQVRRLERDSRTLYVRSEYL